MFRLKTQFSNDLFIVFLACLSLTLLVFEKYFVEDITSEQLMFIQAIDISIALIFLSEFLFRLVYTPRLSSFLLYNWWQLLAAIPVTTLPTQALRGLMILRVTSIVARFIIPVARFFSFLTRTRIAPILSIFLFLLLFGSFSFHIIEREINPGINNYWDSLFVSISYMTNTGVNVGAQSSTGEVVGMLMMISGVLTLGVFTAFIASYLIYQRRRQEQLSDHSSQN